MGWLSEWGAAMSNVTLMTGGNAAAIPDARAMMRHYLAPFKASEPWRETISVVERCSLATQRNLRGELIALSPTVSEKMSADAIGAAYHIQEAVADHLPAVAKAVTALEESLAAPPEQIVRLILIEMLKILAIESCAGR